MLGVSQDDKICIEFEFLTLGSPSTPNWADDYLRRPAVSR
jgi:hypothetical protein